MSKKCDHTSVEIAGSQPAPTNGAGRSPHAGRDAKQKGSVADTTNALAASGLAGFGSWPAAAFWLLAVEA